MLRSIFSAISGLRSHQTMLDVTANNIANVNTNGFRASRVTFQDILSQTVNAGAAPRGDVGSVNPQQIGLGVMIGGFDIMTTQGNLQATGRSTDLAIQGDGFFVIGGVGLTQFYTRSGAFGLDRDGLLVNPSTGMRVLGWQADSAGNVNTSSPISSMTIPVGTLIPAQATDASNLLGNIDSQGVTIGDTFLTAMRTFDSIGVEHRLQVTLTYAGVNVSGNNEFTWTAAADPAFVDPSITGVVVAPSGALEFDPTGAIVSASPAGTITVNLNNGANPVVVSVDGTRLSFSASESSFATTSNGLTSGELINFNVGSSGDITGVFSNGATQRLGQVAMAAFTNSAGLLRVGGGAFSESVASGQAIVGEPNTGTRGSITAGNLEMSNVDLATEFTKMITAQRGFQANGRVITTSDEMLQEIVNLKR